jgi:hypothetical protein
VQFLQPLQQFACVVILALIRRSLHVHLQTLQLIQGLKGIAVPQNTPMKARCDCRAYGRLAPEGKRR